MLVFPFDPDLSIPQAEKERPRRPLLFSRLMITNSNLKKYFLISAIHAANRPSDDDQALPSSDPFMDTGKAPVRMTTGGSVLVEAQFF